MGAFVHHLLSALVWALSVLSAAAGFVDFLLSDGARLEVQQRLLSWQKMFDNNWRGLRAWIATKLTEFMTAVFGPRLISLRAVSVTAAVAAVYTCIVLLVAHPQGPFVWSDMPQWLGLVFGIMFIPGLVIELVSITAIRLSLRLSVKRNGAGLIVLLALIPHVVAACVPLITGIIYALNPNAGALGGRSAIIVENIRNIEYNLGLGDTHTALVFVKAFAIPEAAVIALIRNGFDFYPLLFILPFLSSLSVLLIVLGVYLVSLCPHWARSSLSFIVGRMAQAPKGAFSAASVGLASFVGLLKSLFGQG